MNSLSQQLLEIKLLLELRKYGELDEGKLKKLALGALAAGAIGGGAHQLAKSDEPVKTERPAHVRTVKTPRKLAVPTRRVAPRRIRTSAAGGGGGSQSGKGTREMHPAASPETATGHSPAALRVKKRDPTFLTKTPAQIRGDVDQHDRNREAGFDHMQKGFDRTVKEFERRDKLQRDLEDTPEDKLGPVLNKGGMRGAIKRGERPKWGPRVRHPARVNALQQIGAHERETQRTEQEDETKWQGIKATYLKSRDEQKERKHSHRLAQRIKTWKQRRKK